MNVHLIFNLVSFYHKCGIYSSRQCWVYARTEQSLHELLDREIVRELLKMGDSNGFSSNCYLGGG